VCINLRPESGIIYIKKTLLIIIIIKTEHHSKTDKVEEKKKKHTFQFFTQIIFNSHFFSCA